MLTLQTSKLSTGFWSLLMSTSLLVTPVLAADMELLAEKTRVINGKEYTFKKYLDEDNSVKSRIVDRMGNQVSEKVIPRGERRILGKQLQAILDKSTQGRTRAGKVKVNIALEVQAPVTREASQSGGGEVVQGRTRGETRNGRKLSDAELRSGEQNEVLKRQSQHEQRIKHQKTQVMSWAKQHGLEERQDVQQAIKEGRDSLTLELTQAEIMALVKDQKVGGIELYEEPKDQIAQAMVDTSISTSALPNSTTRGNNVGIYMTESGCANESRFNNYDRLSGTETTHSRNVGGILRAVSPESFIYCRGGAVLPTSIDLHGLRFGNIQIIPPLNPPILVANRSNGGYSNADYRTLDRDWDNFVYNNNIPVFNAAGNDGNSTQYVISPSKGLNVIGVGNYNDATDTIASSSAFKDPETGNEKPELSAPGTSITAGGFTLSGTSMASPHAAGFAADLMSRYGALKYRPYLLNAVMLAGATDNIASNNSTSQYEKVGLGGIDFASAAWNGWYWYWTGNNSSFNTFASTDGNNDNYIEKKFYITNSWDKVRAVISWLNRGSYTYSHRNDAHPIGMDLDLQVYGPNGNYVGGSSSWDNSFERVEFEPNVSGYYTFKVKRYANRDTNLNLRLGMEVNLYNE